MEAELINITEDGGVVKKILQPGTGEVPTDKSDVKVTYIGTLQDGTQFDANTDRETGFDFQLGVGDVIKGWDLGVATMKVGEKALFTIKPEYAYGEKAAGKIPSNSTLNFEVELLSFKEREKTKSDYSTEERMAKAKEFKEEGNNFYKNKDWEAYDWADVNSDDDTEDLQCQKFKTLLSGNKAAVFIQLKDWTEVITNCENVILADDKNVKAFYRRSQARGALGLYEKAIEDLVKCKELDPNDKIFDKEILTYKKKIIEDQKKEKQMFSKMFSKGIYQDEKAGVNLSDPSDPSNPVVFFEIKIADQPAQRIEIELYKNVVPKTAENFRQLCLTKYKGTIFHRVIKDFMIQGGDYENRNGTGGSSIYGHKFEDENFSLKHTGRGILSMANAGKNTNGSQFFICFKDTPWLDGKHVVFGRVIKNIEYLDVLERVKTTSDAPDEEIKVVDCGEVEKEKQ